MKADFHHSCRVSAIVRGMKAMYKPITPAPQWIFLYLIYFLFFLVEGGGWGAYNIIHV